MDKLNPDHAAVEQLYFSKNITTGLPVAHARGVILLEAARRGLPVFE
jgi:crossover junction endodeoxyribonuclease RuvC